MQAVSRERTHRTVADLVSFGPRMGGTASGDRSADYVERRLSALGLQTSVVEDPLLDVHEEISWEARILTPEEASLDAWPVGFSASLPVTEIRILTAAPREGRRGIPWAMLTDSAPTAAAAEAGAAGATAVLTDHPREEGRYLDWAPAEALPLDPARTVAAWSVSLNAGKKIRAWLEQGREVRARLTLDTRRGRGHPRTVVATLPGTSPGWYLVCAHGDSDSGGPGADDNASGVASLLEAAASLAHAASLGLLPASRPAVRFAVWGAEMHSTQAFVQSRAAEMASLLGVFNYDQTGTGTETDAIYFEGNDVPWNGRILKALVSVAAERAGRDGFSRTYTTNPSMGGTDSYVFLPREHHGLGILTAKVPATTVFTTAWGRSADLAQTEGWQSPGWPEVGRVRIDYNPRYHSSGDVPSATTDLRPDNMARCARAVALAIHRLMREAPPAAAEPPAGAPPPADPPVRGGRGAGSRWSRGDPGPDGGRG